VIRLFNVYYPVRTLVLLIVEAVVVGLSFLLTVWWQNQETSWILLNVEGGYFEDRLCYGDRFIAFSWVGPVRRFQHGRKVGSDIPPLHGVGLGGLCSRRGRSCIWSLRSRPRVFFLALSGD